MMKRITAFTLALLLILSCNVSFAANGSDTVEDTPSPFTPVQVITGGTITRVNSKGVASTTSFSFSIVADVCTAPDGRIFVADSNLDTGRVFVFNPDGTMATVYNEAGEELSGLNPINTIKAINEKGRVANIKIDEKGELSSKGATTSLKGCEGVFFHAKNNELYIADTGNQRIVVLDGTTFLFKRFIYRPDNMTGDTEFKPAKIAVDSTGRIFTTVNTGYEGIIVLNENGSFSRYFGESEEMLSLSEEFYLQQANELYIADPAHERIVVLIASNLLLKHFIYRPDNMPDNAEFKPFKVAVDSIGRIYVTVRDNYEGNFVLNPDGSFSHFFKGENISYYYPEAFSNVTVDSQDYVMAVKLFEDAPRNMFRMNANGENLLSESHSTFEEENARFVDIAVHSNGSFAVLDEDCRVFLYGADNLLLSDFSLSPARYTSIAWQGDNLLIASRSDMCIYEPTTYGLTLLNTSEDFTPIAQ